MFAITSVSLRFAKAARRKVHRASRDLVLQAVANHWRLMGASPTPIRGLEVSSIPTVTQRDVPRAPSVLPLPEGAVFSQDRFVCLSGTRRYLTYIPASAKNGVTGLILMLHGATQTPEDFADGTAMNALAEKQGFIVVYPHQSRSNQVQSSWKWFERRDQGRNRGEPALLAGLTRLIVARYGVPKDKVFVAGLSAGAAMAVILGETYPDIFSAVGAHSGLPTGAALNVPTAFAAMAGLSGDSGSAGPAMRTSVFHGSADATVRPSNGDRIARNAHDGDADDLDQSEDDGETNGRRFHVSTTFALDGTESVEHWVVDGAGHAWSGGQPSGSYTDAQGPDASAEMVRFFFSANREK